MDSTELFTSWQPGGPVPIVAPRRDFRYFAAIAPALLAIRADARRANRDVAAGRRRKWPAWSAIKRRLERVVGWNARDPELADAYDVCYRHLLDIFEGAD